MRNDQARFTAFNPRPTARGGAHIAASGKAKIIVEIEESDGGVHRWETLGEFKSPGVVLEQTPIYEGGTPRMREVPTVEGGRVARYEPDNLAAIQISIKATVTGDSMGDLTRMSKSYPTLRETPAAEPEPSMACTSSECEHVGRAFTLASRNRQEREGV